MPRRLFLDPELADKDGLVAVGGDLSPTRLIVAYRRGIFPWYDEEGPILWWSPDPRAIFELTSMHISRRLQRTIRSNKFTMTINQDFGGVIRGCADRPDAGTWITTEMIAAYEALHHLGYAHSVEAWHQGNLAGGLYGIAVGGLFAGESMFARIPDASKVALAFVMEHLRQRGFQLFDIQFLTEHTARLGGMEIPRSEYLQRLRKALRCTANFIAL